MTKYMAAGRHGRRRNPADFDYEYAVVGGGGNKGLDRRTRLRATNKKRKLQVSSNNNNDNVSAAEPNVFPPTLAPPTHSYFPTSPPPPLSVLNQTKLPMSAAAPLTPKDNTAPYDEDADHPDDDAPIPNLRSSRWLNYDAKSPATAPHFDKVKTPIAAATSSQSAFSCMEEGQQLYNVGNHDAPQPAVPPRRRVDMLQGCRLVDDFERLNKINEGTYGVVFRAKDKTTGEIVALKKVKMERETEGFPLTALREINILLSFDHPSIINVKEMVVDSTLEKIFMVMEYMEHDLKALMETKKQPFTHSEVKCLMLQLLEAVDYLHDNWVLHRDLKTSNLLLNNSGQLKICDFGLARQCASPFKPYTQLVVTLWYRAPELLLGAKQYSTAIDMWSVGCIMAELLLKQPLFNGKTEVDQIDKIFRKLGTPNETIWPGVSKLPGVKASFAKHPYNSLHKDFPGLSEAGFDLLNKLLMYAPEKRITAADALKHKWFREDPLPMSKKLMPTFPAKHAQDRQVRRMMKSPDPLEVLRQKESAQGKMGSGGLFG